MENNEMSPEQRQQLIDEGWEDLRDNRFLINIADLKNPETGKTYREENLAKIHQFPVGALVEIQYEEENPENGIRLHVIKHIRDCDGSPLYVLGIMEQTEVDEQGFCHKGFTGYSEQCLVLIALPNKCYNDYQLMDVS